jgi:hypothetical protein
VYTIQYTLVKGCVIGNKSVSRSGGKRFQEPSQAKAEDATSAHALREAPNVTGPGPRSHTVFDARSFNRLLICWTSSLPISSSRFQLLGPDLQANVRN